MLQLCAPKFFKGKGYFAILDKLGQSRLVYYDPIIHLPSGKVHTPSCYWDHSSGSLSFSLSEISFPLVIAFELGVKIPSDVKRGFGFFPSFEFGAKGEIEGDESSSESEDEGKGKQSGGFGIKTPKFGDVDKPKSSASTDFSDSEYKGFRLKVPKFGSRDAKEKANHLFDQKIKAILPMNTTYATISIHSQIALVYLTRISFFHVDHLQRVPQFPVLL